MEGGIGGLCVASGVAAITYAIQAIAGVGDNIVSVSQLYGGTYNLFVHSSPPAGASKCAWPTRVISMALRR